MVGSFVRNHWLAVKAAGSVTTPGKIFAKLTNLGNHLYVPKFQIAFFGWALKLNQYCHRNVLYILVL